MTDRKTKNRWSAKAEAVMMGMTQPVDSNEEAIFIAGYIAKTLGFTVTGEEIFKEATQYTKGAEIKYVSVSTIMDMRMLTLPMKTEEDRGEFDIFDRDGVLSYVYNFDASFCSELGYTYFEKRAKGIVRIA